ncbi:unnamed protein product [marine sediment metagenome]|uniref:Asn/Gln amidotransferase domain-containing protein n=1 Tax=marine sediment metagenome TaxID=412755 RepID=X1J8A0_9ZZZZ
MLKDKIQSNLNQALKRGDEITCSTLRMLLAAILSKEKEKRYKIFKEEPELTEKELAEKSFLTDEEVIEVISSEIKKRKEAILGFEKGERKELAEKEKAEMEVLEKYLPEQLSEEEIERLVKEAIEEVGAEDIKDMGKVMAALMPKVKGKADGGLVSKIVKELLNSKEI